MSTLKQDLAANFPGLVDGQTEVNGGDLIEYLSLYTYGFDTPSERDPSIGTDAATTERQARLADWHTPHTVPLDRCRHGQSYSGPCAWCEAIEAAMVERLAEEDAREAGAARVDRADVEGGAE